MVMFVSISQASDHLRRDNNADDCDLDLKIKAASKSVYNYLGATRVAELVDFDSDGEVAKDEYNNPIGVPEEIQSATLIILSMLYNDREGNDFSNGKSSPRTGEIILPRIVLFLLDPLKLPVIA